jgi:hypothetical protein
MKRRVFLKVTGLVAVAGAVQVLSGLDERTKHTQLTAVSDGTRLTIQEAGTYRITGQVRLEQPLVQITGLGQTQSVSWSGAAGTRQQVTSFTAFEHFDAPGLTRSIRVTGGVLEGVTAVPVEYA